MANETFRASDANAITRRYLDSILIEQRLIDSDVPSLKTELFGRTFDTPVMMPAFSHLHIFAPEREDGMREYARAALAIGAVNFVGMSGDEDFGGIVEVGASTVRIVKPYADREKVISQLRYAEKCGAFAVGMDIDHIFSSKGGHDNVFGDEMTTQSFDDIASYVRETKLPFVVKGVLSARDAEKCAEAGASAILVSHHHGRMPFAVPPLMVLPEIRKAVGGKLKIFADCGIDSGADVFKALALGADMAAVGRAIMPPLAKSGAAGVEAYVRGMNDELSMIMAFTGCKTLDMIDSSLLWIDGKHIKD